MQHTLESLKRKKYEYALFSYNDEATYFMYDDLQLPSSEYTQTYLEGAQQKIFENPSYRERMYAKIGTYTFGDRDFVWIDAASIEPIIEAYTLKRSRLSAWLKEVEYWLGEATTEMEVLDIASLYTNGR